MRCLHEVVPAGRWLEARHPTSDTKCYEFGTLVYFYMASCIESVPIMPAHPIRHGASSSSALCLLHRNKSISEASCHCGPSTAFWSRSHMKSKGHSPKRPKMHKYIVGNVAVLWICSK